MKDDDKAANDEKRPQGASAERVVQERIGEQLRAMYAHVANEPVPERFLRLLDQLEQSEESKPK